MPVTETSPLRAKERENGSEAPAYMGTGLQGVFDGARMHTVHVLYTRSREQGARMCIM